MTISPSEISSVAQRVYQHKQDVRSQFNQMKSDINQAKKQWKGLASNQFNTKSTGVLNELQVLLRDIDSLENEIRRLASDVRRANDERLERKRMEERLKLQQAKK